MTAISPDFARSPSSASSSGGGGTVAAIETGTIVETADATIPSDFLLCDGAVVSRTTYAALFAKIGTSYGKGDGSTTFGLPKIPARNLPGYIQSSLPVSSNYKLTVLLDGRILAIGGANAYLGTITVDGNISWIAATAYPTSIQYGGLHTLSDGRVLYIAGYNGSAVVSACYFGTVVGNTITWVAGTALPAVRNLFASMILSDGRILVVAGGSTFFGGNQSTTYFGTISGTTITWVAGTAYPVAIREFSGASLPDGTVICTGGYSTAAQVNCYRGSISGTTITWTLTEPLPQAKSGHETLLLPTGYIFINSGNLGGSSYTRNNAIGHITYDSIVFITAGVPSHFRISYYGACVAQNMMVQINAADVLITPFLLPIIKT